MSTVIDELVMAFGLDGSKFEAGAKKAGGNLKKLKEDAGKTAKDMEAEGQKAARFFTQMQTAAIQFFGVLAGATGLTQMITQVVALEAQLGRLADRTGQASESLQAFGNVAELFGGKAEDMQAGMSALSQAMVNMKYKGEMSPTLMLFSQLGVRIADANGQMRDQSDILLDLASTSERMSKQDFFNLAQSAGLNPSMIEVVMKGRRELEKYLTEQRKNSLVTKDQTDKARRLSEQFGQLKQSGAAMSREFVSNITPSIERFFGYVQRGFEWVQQNSEFIKGIFIGIAAVITGYFAPALLAASIAAAPLIILIGGLIGGIALLWEDYQKWKNGGKSLIDWAKWEPEIRNAVGAINGLKNAILGLFGTSQNKSVFVNFLRSVGGEIGQIFREVLNTIGNITKAIEYATKGEWVKAGLALVSSDSWKNIDAGVVDPNKGSATMGIVDAFARIGNAILDPWRAGNELDTSGHSNPNASKKTSGGNAPIQREASMKAALAYFVAQGWTPAQAAGIVANLHSESAMNPSAVGDGGRAYGLAQWHPDRQANFRQQFGKDIRQASMSEQLAFVHFELTKGNEQRAGRALRQSTEAGQAGAVISRLYERPMDTDGEARKRAGLASRIGGGIQPQQYAAGARAQAAIAQPAASTGNRTTVENNIGQVVIQTNATDAKGIAMGVPMALQQSLSGATYHFDTGQQ